MKEISSPSNGENGFHKGPAAPQQNGTSSSAAPVVKRRQSTEAIKTNLKNQYRCSLINLEETKDEELDAILGELSILESQFQEEITAENTTSSNSMQNKTNIKQPSPVASVTSSTGSRSSPSSETAKKPASNNGKRTESPDTDSAFCDNLSVLSSCSTSSRFVSFPDKSLIKVLLRNY